jgi:4-amino-4-deoxy-L-arabinose transferase-like glycosyltransferase
MAMSVSKSLGCLLIAGFVLRVALLVAVRDVGVYIDDERDYVQLAENIAAGRGFAIIAGQPTSKRPPLYPALIAGLWQLPGVSRLQVVRVAQIVLSLGSVIVLFLLARRLFDARVALWAAAAWCFYPGFLYAGVVILTEVLFTVLVLAGCLCAVFVFDRPHQSGRWALATGVLVGLAALTRSVLWPLPLALIPIMVAIAQVSWTRRLVAGVAVILGYTAVVGPWAIRNTILQRTLVVVDTLGGLNLRMGNYEDTLEDRMWDGVSLSGDKAWSHAMVVEHPAARYWTEGEWEKWARQRAVEYMAARPLITVRRAALKFADFWGLEREYVAAVRAGIYRPPAWFGVASTAATFLSYVGIMVLACTGLFARRWSNWRVHVVPLLVLAWICGIHTIVFGHSRYHLPVMPIVIVYAAAAVTDRSWRFQTMGRLRSGFAVGAIALLALIWSREVLFRDFERIRQLLAIGGL